METSFSKRVKAELIAIPCVSAACDWAEALVSGQTEPELLPLDSLKNAKLAKEFVRCLFVLVGNVSDPAKAHHLEMSFRDEKLAELAQSLLLRQRIETRLFTRKPVGSSHKARVLYIKEAEAIAETLAWLGAGAAYCEYENAIILRSLRNLSNRQANCDSANTDKAVDTAARQLAAIRRIDETCGLDSLPPHLMDCARKRMQNAELPLGEFARLLSPPVGKSGANHRLRRLEEIAAEL